MDPILYEEAKPVMYGIESVYSETMTDAMDLNNPNYESSATGGIDTKSTL